MSISATSHPKVWHSVIMVKNYSWAIQQVKEFINITSLLLGIFSGVSQDGYITLTTTIDPFGIVFTHGGTKMLILDEAG